MSMNDFELGIGDLSGAIWKYVDEFGAVSTFKLKIVLATTNAKIYLALGWLLRENKIKIEPMEKGYKVSKI